ncbi:MAG: hypothetical protein ACYCSG_00120 [Thermoplasmataceae archaeon]
MIYEHDPEFYRVLGYLASPVRKTKLDIETHPNKAHDVESRYKSYSGNALVKDDRNYFVWSPEKNKWGSELRIYFVKNSNIPTSLSNMVVNARFPGGKYNARVNSNDFVWLLIKYGFLTGDGQNDSRIRAKIPSSHQQEFDNGYAL